MRRRRRIEQTDFRSFSPVFSIYVIRASRLARLWSHHSCRYIDLALRSSHILHCWNWIFYQYPPPTVTRYQYPKDGKIISDVSNLGPWCLVRLHKTGLVKSSPTRLLPPNQKRVYISVHICHAFSFSDYPNQGLSRLY